MYQETTKKGRKKQVLDLWQKFFSFLFIAVLFQSFLKFHIQKKISTKAIFQALLRKAKDFFRSHSRVLCNIPHIF